MTNVKACHSCKEYVHLDPSVPGEELEKKFNYKHRGHMVQVVNLSEVQDEYKKFE